MKTADKQTLKFWRDEIVVGKTFLRLTDERSILLAMQAGKGVEGEDRQVKRSRRFKHSDDLFEIIFYDLGDGLYVAVKIVDQEFDLRVYREIEEDGFQSGNRQDQIDRENFWLFQEPDSEEFDVEELEMSEFFDYQPENEIGDFKTRFETKPIGTVVGSIKENPIPSGCDGERFTVLTEYQSVDENHPAPEAIVLEVGGEEGEEGGYMTFLFGNNITPTEVDFL